MSQAPAMPVFTDALIGDTTHLTTMEFGAYCLILFVTWRNNGVPLPDDDKRLARICRMTAGQWQKSRPTLVEFFDLSEGTWRQKRLEKEWVYVQKISSVQSKKGKRSAEVRALKNNKTRSTDVGTGLEPDANPHTYTQDISPNGENPPVSPKPSKPRKVAGSIKDDWQPSAEDIAFAEGKGNGAQQIAALAEAFQAHHRAKGSVFKDWAAAWRTWVLKDIQFHGDPHGRLPFGGEKNGPSRHGASEFRNGFAELIATGELGKTGS